MLGVFTLSTSSFKTVDKEEQHLSEICDWEYVNAFIESWVMWNDVWAAESAALTAESECEDRTGIDEFLNEIN